MPWNKSNYPDSMKNLRAVVRNKAIEIANALLEEGLEEGIAIATGISRAKDWAKNRGKEIRTAEGRKKGRQTDVKVHGEDRYVIPYQGEWAIRREKKKSVDRFHYKRDAVSKAREEAKKVNGNLIIQNADGKIQKKYSYNPNRKA